MRVQYTLRVDARIRLVAATLCAGCSVTTPSFTAVDGAADSALGTHDVPADVLSERLTDAGDTGALPMDASVVADVPPLDIQSIDTPPPPIDVGMDLVALADLSSDVGPTTVDQCYLIGPAVALATPAGTGPAVDVAVFVSGVTPGIGMGAGVEVQVGSGAAGTLPLTSGTWMWTPSVYASDIDGTGPTGALSDDRYTGSATVPPTPGEYAFAARARIDGGAWRACDLVSTVPHAYDPAFEGRLTVALVGSPVVAYCNLQSPETLSAPAGGTASAVVYSRVYAPGVTDQGCTGLPTGTTLVGQWGVGPVGSYPSDATWTWTPGAYADHRDSNSPLIPGDCHDVEFTATPTAPTTCGTFAYGFRYRLGTGPWAYCRWAPPAMGAPSTPPWDTWLPSLAGTLTVSGCM